MFSKPGFKIAFSLNKGGWGADLPEDRLLPNPLGHMNRPVSPSGVAFLIGLVGQHQAGRGSEQAVLSAGESTQVAVGGRLSQGSELSCSRVHPSWSLGNQWAQSLQPAAGHGAASLVWTASKSDDSPLCPATSTRDRVNRGHSKEAQFKRTEGFHMGGGSNPRMHFRFSGPENQPGSQAS